MSCIDDHNPRVSPEPQQIGPYTIIRPLGQGGMGVVYLARDQGSRLVALKRLREGPAGDAGFRRRFTREVEAARSVARFCTAPVLDAGIDGESAYIVTEYVDGPDLATAVRKRGPMAGADLEALSVGVATALTAIHQAGVVHRDLKPQNILLSPVGPRVIDFGIAQLVEPDASRSTGIVGTPAYMSPEQAHDPGPGLGGSLEYRPDLQRRAEDAPPLHREGRLLRLLQLDLGQQHRPGQIPIPRRGVRQRAVDGEEGGPRPAGARGVQGRPHHLIRAP
ncbi:serine/threonine-protein kinase [Nonomuraea angiospora]|uniref:serine/threonine-protein kinase n=1 Tax=Nonomuraea angiospora TaxID=46172 RepID=UPI003324CAB2